MILYIGASRSASTCSSARAASPRPRSSAGRTCRPRSRRSSRHGRSRLTLLSQHYLPTLLNTVQRTRRSSRHGRLRLTLLSQHYLGQHYFRTKTRRSSRHGRFRPPMREPTSHALPAYSLPQPTLPTLAATVGIINEPRRHSLRRPNKKKSFSVFELRRPLTKLNSPSRPVTRVLGRQKTSHFGQQCFDELGFRAGRPREGILVMAY